MRVSLTDAMVCRGPRMRRTFRKPKRANTAVTTTIMANTSKKATQRQIQVSSSSATKKKKKKVE
ncbi:Uncharacterised protein [Mycobacterium tuberculosis]|uniref:Uncharacterized protein n=1 Tax=Mycobacterium tuberculosis TaxID=1773 RepID=A0A655JT15_MYCTX|nr:Uncharacterised protein [Mycobacterium tuberculosis]COX81614.1 Uncharacterised protein [Mycobacterium tuberculosis]COY73677.1 Uncharacterised protein [Mycobacterium tuberculosis]